VHIFFYISSYTQSESLNGINLKI